MIRHAFKRAALAIPSIRRLKQQRDAALRQVTDLSRRLQEFARKSTVLHCNAIADSDAAVNLAVERALSLVRAEYTSLPRFAYHLPLDYEIQTLPPQFDPPIFVDGEPLPVPPATDRHGHFDDAAYLDWGRYDHDIILNHIQRSLPSMKNLAIMDFGCSSGRVLRHFLAESRNHSWTLTGVDVSARRIEWMRRNFPPEFQVYTGTVLPSLPFESNSFDVIYGLSVFTHLKFLWDSWLLELRRVLKPGGLLIQSIHTETAWNFFSQHGHEPWVRDSLGPMVVEQKEMPADFVYFGDVSDNKVFWKKDVAIAFWSRYLQDVEVFPPPEKYWYQDWIIGRKATKKELADVSPPNCTSTKPTRDHSPGTHKVEADPDKAPNVARRSVIFTVGHDFSQYGEQAIILDFFSRYAGNFNPYCVDAGAYDGVVGSNSRALFLNGWRGILIEPNPRTFARLRALYAGHPGIVCVQTALSDTRRESVTMKFAIGPADTVEEDKWKYAQVSTLHDDWAASYEKDFGYVYEASQVAMNTLTNVLRELEAPRDIGFLSIDCEGEDLRICRELDLGNFRPLLVCVEADGDSRHLYAKIIEPQGYTLHSYTVANSFFRLNG